MAEADLSDTAMEINFPEDIWIEILVRVPAEYLVKFTKVSKSWYSLITSSRFISNHLARIKIRRPKSILTRYYSVTEKQEHYTLHPDNDDFVLQSSEIELPRRSRSDYYTIVGSCNGLICLCDAEHGTTNPIFVWNPSIRRWIELPIPNIEPYSRDITLGFGCDLQQLDYKVVRNVLLSGNDGVWASEVYSLSSKRWRKVAIVPIRRHLVISPSAPVLINGIVHWKDCDEESSLHHYLGFDLKDETFSEVFFPDDLATAHPGLLRELSYNDCLAVLMTDEFRGFCNLWVMKEYGNVKSWENLLKFKLVEGIERVIGFRNNGHCLAPMTVDELFLNDPSSKVLVSFDMHNSGAVKDLDIFGTHYSIYAEHFLESLVLFEGQCRF
ncbi:OLC1v1022821C1 [Oldenlandia corymbosa var. corymbosa]|uniref:OLC1v1022821C1 n=1 Tax=Oldenlandia corymbosa var. corymbosa TaxID=529605 RepID=A0AAV1C122_OLDCO|nr:OLC1v1022821C1 [Oldenlandia corymbosa var. corymbosa]